MYISASDVADHFDVTRNTVYSWVRRYNPPCPHYRVGKLYRFVLPEVQQWRDERSRRPNPQAKHRRNEEIRRRIEAGETMQEVADDHGISRQRVEQIWRPERERARKVANGIDIPDGTPCERCGVEEAAERHHPDYTDPELVELLCRPCHGIADRERWSDGHLLAEWNTYIDGKGRTCCKECRTRRVQQYTTGGRLEDVAPQYDICLALHETGAVEIEARSLAAEAAYRDGLTIRASRSGVTRWILRDESGREFARVDTGEQARVAIRDFLAGRLTDAAA